jgi:hypothetical protein
MLQIQNCKIKSKQCYSHTYNYDLVGLPSKYLLAENYAECSFVLSICILQKLDSLPYTVYKLC